MRFTVPRPSSNNSIPSAHLSFQRRILGAISVTLVASTFIARTAFGADTLEMKVGEYHASYSPFKSAAAVCEAEATWLSDELQSVNTLLDAFLERGTTRRGAWSERDLPLMEQATAVLPRMLASHKQTLKALQGCSLGKEGRFPKILTRGFKVTAEAEAELVKLPGLIRFTRHRIALERWERQRSEAEQRALVDCQERKKEPHVYFAWEDEFQVRHWAFCDGSRVDSAPAKNYEFVAALGAEKDSDQATANIQTAKFFPASQILQAPRAE